MASSDKLQLSLSLIKTKITNETSTNKFEKKT